MGVWSPRSWMVNPVVPSRGVKPTRPRHRRTGLRGDPSAPAEVARSRNTHIRRLNRQIDTLSARIARAVTQSGTSLTGIYGIGALVAADILTEVGNVFSMCDHLSRGSSGR